MQLKLKESSEIPHEGYGAGSGQIIKKEYVCPCGNGTVYYEKDDIPGFRESDIYCDCEDCNSKYNFARGTASLK
ncbi:hypothetical protein [Oceanobacillus damuensis]|uniref:hypothetical protein n=1 Tax=Oceanobacillus damuensis TaxID=937928 RepID=UPI000831525F|nr:hypothetical protein [Oceanobacillus damuensis]